MKNIDKRKVFLKIKKDMNEDFDFKRGSSSGQSYFKQAVFSYETKFPLKIVRVLNEVQKIFSFIIKTKRSDFYDENPYKIKVEELVVKNRWTESASYIAINNDNGTLTLRLNIEKVLKALSKSRNGVQAAFLLMFFHEFRHKIQNESGLIKSVINYGNWGNFNEFMQKEYNKDQDEIDHIFHELDPSEIDAHIFACEMTGLPFNGTIFDINDETLKILKKD